MGQINMQHVPQEGQREKWLYNMCININTHHRSQIAGRFAALLNLKEIAQWPAVEWFLMPVWIDIHI